MGDEFRVESRNGVPQILRDGRSIPPYMIYVNNLSWELTRVTPQWTPFTAEFKANIDNAETEVLIGLPFPGSHRKFSNRLDLSSLKLEDVTAGKVIFHLNSSERFRQHLLLKNHYAKSNPYHDDSGTVARAFLTEEGRGFLRIEGRNSNAWLSLQSFPAVKGHEYRLSGWIRAREPQTFDSSLFSLDTNTQIVTPNRIVREQVQLAAAAGVDLINVRIAPVFVEPGKKPDFSEIDFIFEEMIRANPRAQLLIRLRRTVPAWWFEANPGERIVNVPEGVLPVPSPASEKFRHDLREAIRRMIRYCESKYPDNIAGWHPTGCGNDEWFYITGRKNGSFCDYSEPAVKAFRKFLKKKYVTDDALRQGWKRSDVSLETAEIPPASLRGDQTGSVFFLPQNDQALIDHNLFLQDNMAEIILALCSVVREETGRKRLSSCFYGYTTECAAFSNGPATSGHYGLRKVLDSDVVDILIGPYDYNYREFGGICATMTTAESIMRSGKLWLQEDDTHTCLAHETGHKAAGYEKGVTTFRETQLILRRNLLANTLRNYATWFMDIGGTGYYNDVRLWDELRRFAPVEKALREKPRPYAPPVAAIFDEHSMSYLKKSAVYAAARPMIKADRENRGKIGMPLGDYLFDDYLANPLPSRYDILISAYAMTPAQRQTVRRHSQAKPTIFCWATGSIDCETGTLSLRAVAEATGFKARLHSGGELTHVLTAAGTAAGLEPRRPPVRTTVFSPLFTVELQNGDVVWATFGNGEPAVVFRPGKVPTLFCGTPNLPQGIYRAFLKMCHAPFPVSDPAFTVANPPYFMTSILDTGRYLFSPSEEPSRKWSELAPGTVSAQSAPLIRRFRKGEVLLLKEEK